MKPVTQTRRGGPDVPPAERGDCWDACLASILELPIEAVPVPHSDDPAESWWDVSQMALAAYGYEAVRIDERWWPRGYWIAGVPSLNLGPTVRHVVVMEGNAVAHDPSLGERYAACTLAEDLDINAGYVLVLLPPDALKA